MSIEALARELVEVRTNSKRLLEEGDIDGWLATLTPQFLIAEQLRSYLLSHPVVVTGDPSVKCLLRSIDQTDLEDHHKTGKQLLFSLISPAEYACRLAEVTVLVAPSQVPPALRNFLDEARQCYAFGQLSAVQSLSRTI